MSLHSLIRAVVPEGAVVRIGCLQFSAPLTNLPDRESHEDHLRALEAAGADPAALAKALMDAYHICFPLFRGLGDGFRRRDQISPNDSLMGLWALVTFRDGWRVLEHLGTTWATLLNYLFFRWPPRMWLMDTELLRVPHELRTFTLPEGLVFGPQAEPLDLNWLPWRIAAGLSITGPIPSVSLPKALECRGPVHLERVGGIRTLKGITAPGKYLTVVACQDLERIDLPANTELIVKNCYQLHDIAGKITADLHVEGCPSLEVIRGVFPRDAHPAPALTIRNCLRLKAMGQPTSVARTCGALILEDCPELNYFQNPLTIRGHKIVTNCPALGPVKGGW